MKVNTDVYNAIIPQYCCCYC